MNTEKSIFSGDSVPLWSLAAELGYVDYSASEQQILVSEFVKVTKTYSNLSEIRKEFSL